MSFYDHSVYFTDMTINVSQPQRGRPREFDEDVAIESAMNAFWTLGYHGASLPELLEATNLSRGSLYAAFGDKHGLFLLALDRYINQSLGRLESELLSKNALGGLRTCLTRYSERIGETGKRGCLIVATAMELAGHDAKVARRIAYFFDTMETWLRDALTRAQDAGQLADGLDPAVTARLIMCTIEGRNVVDKTNFDRAKTKKMFMALIDYISQK